jgi:hypothetical protein
MIPLKTEASGDMTCNGRFIVYIQYEHYIWRSYLQIVRCFNINLGSNIFELVCTKFKLDYYCMIMIQDDTLLMRY